MHDSRAQQSRDYNRLVFRYNIADYYSLSRHVVFRHYDEVCLYAKLRNLVDKLNEYVAVPEKLNSFNRHSH